MKITKLKISEFQQFRNLDLDFTYPKGHKKEGEPLDKVCFIGQSGAGKTTLLKIFSGCIFNMFNPSKGRIDNGIEECQFKYGKDYFNYSDGHQRTDIKNINKQLIYFKSDIQANDKVLSIQKVKEKPTRILGPAKSRPKTSTEPRKRVIFSNNFDNQIWENILKPVDEYRLKYSAASKKLGQEVSKNPNEANEAIQRFVSWEKENPNPYDKIAEECLNPILNDFNLKLDTENTKEFYFPIQHIGGTEIPPNGLSTGTKQVLLTALPIYLFNTKDTIILFDEPERSLFPDIQLKIVTLLIP